MSDEASRAYATYILEHGLRFTESTTLDSDNVITGKGGKKREIHVRRGFKMPAPIAYHRLRGALKRVGLKPHDLRKIFASELVNRGANPFELTDVMGWSSLNTAQSYIAANKAKIKQLVAGKRGLLSKLTQWAGR